LLTSRKQQLARGVFFAFCLVLIGLLGASLLRIRIDTNIVNTLPQGNPVMAEGSYVLLHHPFQNQVFIDLRLDHKDPDRLVEGAQVVEQALKKSGLFKAVGFENMGDLLPALMKHVAKNLPVLFSKRQLESEVSPLLSGDKVRARVKNNLSRLYTMEAVGQAGMVMNDPLGLSGLILKQFKQLLPAETVHFYKGRLLSQNREHLLIIASPKAASTNAANARRIAGSMEEAKTELFRQFEGTGNDFTVTPVGAYRAVLDNESTAKSDTKNAILFAGLGIAGLLMLSFPRPLIGLLAFLPAVFGTLCALALYGLWHDSISIMTIGFGGAIVSITVDHGISYLLFLDRPHETKGRNVSREVMAVAFLAAMTSVGAFLMLTFSGFPILAQIGQFAAFGIAFSFLFVHSFFPLLFPRLRPARRSRTLFLQRLVDKLATGGGRVKAAAALLLVGGLCFFAHPDFNVNMESINTISEDTIAAENRIADIWGKRIFDQIYLMAEAKSLGGLQKRSDTLTGWMEAELAKNNLSQAFLPSELFPGASRCRQNLKAWRQFWARNDKSQVRKDITQAAAELGVPPDAFSNIYQAPAGVCSGGFSIPKKFHRMLGIYQASDTPASSGTPDPDEAAWLLFTSLSPGENYAPERFFHTYAEKSGIHVLDPDYYSKTLGLFLSDTFTHMLLIIGLSVAALLLLFFMDASLCAAGLLPIGFSMICTLGTLNLMGEPLNIPGLMLSVVVVGMGLDYSLYFVRSYQRYRQETHPNQARIRMTVFLAGASTLIGFGALSLGEHNLMKSLGLILVLGIGYVMIGTYALLPPLLRRLFRPVQFSGEFAPPGSKLHQKRLRELYKHLEAYPRIFAWCKRRMDPMFAELPAFIGRPGAVLDIGCGYGVTIAWLRAMDPQLRIQAVDPAFERVRIADALAGPNGLVKQGSSPDLPDFQGQPDLVLMLDMAHYLSDDQLRKTLLHLNKKMRPGARLILRTTVPSAAAPPLYRRVETIKLRLAGRPAYYRFVDHVKELLAQGGFVIEQAQTSGQGREEYWFIGRPGK